MTIEDRLNREPEAWKPQPGDRLIGTVVEVEEYRSDYGTYPMITISTDDGQEWMFHAFHTVARTEIERKQPKPGDRIGIAYHGLSEKGYEQYRIVLERQNGVAVATRV